MSNMVLQNTIEKGVHGDNDFYNQPPGTLLSSKNGRIIDNHDGNYTWQNQKGNTVEFTLKTNYKPIGFAKIETGLIVFSTDDDSGFGGTGEIGILIFGAGATIYNPLYYHADLKFSMRFPIEAFALKEADNIERVYFSDNFNDPRVINIGELDRYSAISTFVNGQEYLVIEGELIYGVTITAGNTFTYSGGPVTGTGYCVVYTPVKMLSWQPQTKLPIVKFTEGISGSLTEGGYFIAVRLGLNSGYVTPFMYVSNIIPVLDRDSGVHHNAYQETFFHGDERVTSIGLRFTIENLDTDYDYYEVVLFKQTNWEETKSGKIAYKKEITSSSDSFDLTSYLGFGDISSEDIVINPVPIDLVKTMSMIKLRSSVGNIKERSEFNNEQTFPGVSLASEVYEIPVNSVEQQGTSVAEGDALLGGKKVITLAAGNDDIIPGQWYKVTVGSIVYPPAGTTYNAGDVFQGTDSNTDFTGTGTVVPIIRIKKYFDRVAGEIIYDDYILDDWYDYKSKIVSEKMISYWDDKYRFGILFFDLRGYPYYIRWIGDHKFPRRQKDSNDTNAFNGRTPVSARLVKKRATGLGSPYAYTWNANIMSLIVNDLDLTDIIDEISGFAIVRSAAEQESVAECVLQRMITDSLDSSYKPNSSLWWSISSQTKKLYKLNFPDFLLNTISVDKNIHKLELQRYVPYAADSTFVSDSGRNHSHAYMLEESDPSTLPAVVLPGEENDITHVIETEIPTDMSNLIEYDVGNEYQYIAKNIAITVDSPCSEGIIIATERAEDGSDLPTTGFGDSGVSTKGVIVKIVKKGYSDFGGTSKESLQATEYMFTGHFQKIDDAFKTAIKSGSDYIVDSIQVFGGDCFVGIFSYLDRYNYTPNGANALAHGSHVMLQSRSNIAMMGERSFARLRYYKSGSFPNGIRFYDGSDYTPNKNESRTHNLSSIISTWNSRIRFPNLPSDFNVVVRHERKIRFSEIKLDGASIDVFRKYLVDNEINLNHYGGPITKIASKNDRLYYWQRKTVGYIPVGERAMKTSEIGLPVQLGVGGIFERTDDVLKTFGCQHQLSVIETDQGFAWCDFIRRSVIHMSYDFNLREESEILGMKRLIDSFDDTIEVLTAIMWEGGIVSGYDSFTKEIIMTFKGMLDSNTIIINSSRNQFVGERAGYPLFFAGFNKYLLTSDGNNNNVYIERDGQFANFYGNDNACELSMIINDKSELKKSFDFCRALGGQNFFDQIVFETDYNEDTGTFDTIITENVTNNKHYEYIQGSWDFSIPLKTNKESLIGHFMKITFKISPGKNKLVKFNKLLTNATPKY